MPTPNVGLTQPAQGTNPWDTIVNGNMTIIDNCFGGTVVVPAIASTNIKPNNVTTILAGVAALVAKVDLTAQAANIGITTLYAVPAGGAGIYRVSPYAVVTQAAAGGTPTSTLPAIAIQWTDNDTGVVDGANVTPASSGNIVGTTCSSNIPFTSSALSVFNVKASTNITFSTSGYASTVTPTPMQYAIHIKLEYLGL